ncbi:MAG: GNAT family N-acetyltransferase [Flavobacteriales bacterium]|nr:GNAT family N-acetyltransferase [Flavobacteriales bacterium]
MIDFSLVKLARTDEDLLQCKKVLMEFRPILTEENFLPTLREMLAGGYNIAYVLEENIAVAAIGYRYLQFLHCGKHFYIDDLTTLPQARKKGYGTLLLEFIFEEARSKGFEVVTLDSGFHRLDAHRLYLNNGFNIASLHFVKKL